MNDPRLPIVRLVQSVPELATLPEVTVRLVDALENPRCSQDDLHRLIAADPSLVAKILRVANSSFYGFSHRVQSFERALALLGMRAVRNIAISASLGPLFRRESLCDGISTRDLWLHSVAVAVAARHLATQIQPDRSEEAYLGGMVHDLGMLVLAQSSPELLGRVFRLANKTGESFCRLERQLLRMDHQQVGTVLAEQWKLPRSCQLVACYHHFPQWAGESERLLPAIAYVADTICCQSGAGLTLSGQGQAADQSGMPLIHQEAIENTREALPQLIATATEWLE